MAQSQGLLPGPDLHYTHSGVPARGWSLNQAETWPERAPPLLPATGGRDAVSMEAEGGSDTQVTPRSPEVWEGSFTDAQEAQAASLLPEDSSLLLTQRPPSAFGMPWPNTRPPQRAGALAPPGCVPGLVRTAQVPLLL